MCVKQRQRRRCTCGSLSISLSLVSVCLSIYACLCLSKPALIARLKGPTWGTSIWGRQDPGGTHVGPMNLAIWVSLLVCLSRSVSLTHTLSRIGTPAIPLSLLVYDISNRFFQVATRTLITFMINTVTCCVKYIIHYASWKPSWLKRRSFYITLRYCRCGQLNKNTPSVMIKLPAWRPLRAFNSLFPGGCGCNIELLIFIPISRIGILLGHYVTS